MNPIYRGQEPPKNTDVLWVKGDQIFIYTPEGWKRSSTEVNVDSALIPDSENPVQSNIIQNAISSMEENITESLNQKQDPMTFDGELSDSSTNPIKNNAVYNQYMNAEEIADILDTFGPDYYQMPLTFKFLDTDTISFNGSSSLMYSKNGGAWTNYTSSSVTIPVEANDTISLITSYSQHTWNFGSNNYCFINATKPFDVYGRLSSIIEKNWNFTYSEQIQDGDAYFIGFFKGSPVRNAKHLILLKYLFKYGYKQMFLNCTSLLTGPKLRNLHAGGTSNSSINTSCIYEEMFKGCTSLKEVETESFANALYYQTYPNGSYSSGKAMKSMFEGCTSLKEITGEINLYNTDRGSCNRMFYGCTSLVKAPLLKNTLSADNSNDLLNIAEMFYGCSSLKELRCQSSNNTTKNNYYNNWVYGVNATGVFYKGSGTSWTTGANGIPEGWEVRTLE